MKKRILFLVLAVALFGISAQAQTKQPKTVRDFFNLLPYKYFELDACQKESSRNCVKARAEYLQTFLKVDDAANGYLEGGCDGGQACIQMSLFKRPDDTYIIGVGTSTTITDDNYFLEYRNGRWFDVSAKVVPQFSKNNTYELPRYGTKIEVFAKKIIERGSDYVISEKGAKIYDLAWSDGKFTIKK
jgi:hypothetical protein